MNTRFKIACVIYSVIFLCSNLVWSHEVFAGKNKSKGKPEISYVPGRILVKFRGDESGMAQVRAENLMAAIGAFDSMEIPNLGVQILQLQEGANAPALVEILKSHPDVEFAELDQLVAPDEMIPDDPGFASEWHLTKIAAPDAWSTTTGLSNIVIAVCDTGVDSTHPDLASKMVPGWNMYNNNPDTSDVYGHGTMVAGTVAASTNNQQGVASVAWGCLIMPVRISDPSGLASYSTIASGIRWAADHGARVANVSYKVTTSSSVTSAASYMNSKGGVVTVSAGNDGLFDSSADNPYILTVSATDASDNLYSWSSRGNNIDVAAPGNVYTCTRGGGYGSAFGTSFSAPIVAGLAALVISTSPNLTATQIQNRVKQSADDLGTAGWDANYGWGRVNAANAVAGGPAPDTTPPTIAITAPTEGSNVNNNVAVEVDATDNVGVTKVELYVDGELTSTAKSAPFTTKWYAKRARAGAHTLQCKAYDAADNVGLSAVVTVNR